MCLNIQIQPVYVVYFYFEIFPDCRSTNLLLIIGYLIFMHRYYVLSLVFILIYD